MASKKAVPAKRVSRRKAIAPLAEAPAVPRKGIVPADAGRILEYLSSKTSATSPVRRAADTYLNFMSETQRAAFGDDIAIDLAIETARVERGDMRRMENMLVGQAHALDGIFHQMVQRAAVANDLEVMDSFMRMGLRAQGQSRAAIEALNEIKNPRSVSFVRQANIAQNQQVNNNDGRTPPQQSENQPTELRGVIQAQAMDPRGPGKASRGHSAPQAVGAVHGAKKRGR